MTAPGVLDAAPSAAHLARLAALAQAMARAGKEVNHFPGLDELGELVTGAELGALLAQAGAAPAGRPWALFVHVPFCRTTCTFCCLETRVARAAAEREEYTELLVRELALMARPLGRVALTDFHLGGGTPTELSAAQLRRLLAAVSDHTRRSGDTYFAAEGNPESVTAEGCAVLGAYALVRLSLGVQSLEPRVLRRIGRAYQTPGMVAEAVRIARDAGIPWVSLDLVCGLPEDTRADFLASVDSTAELAPDSLVICPWGPVGSHLWRQGLRPDLAELEARQRDWNDDAARRLATHGYELRRTPLSLAAFRPGGLAERLADRASKGGPYYSEACLGLGVGAASHLPGRLRWRHHDEAARAAALRAGRLPDVWGLRLDDDAERRDFLVTYLAEGFSRARYRRRFGADPVADYPALFDYFSARGEVEISDRRVQGRFADERAASVAAKLWYTAAELDALERRYADCGLGTEVRSRKYEVRSMGPNTSAFRLPPSAFYEEQVERGRRLWQAMAALDKEADYFPAYDELGEELSGAEVLDAWAAFADRAARTPAVNRLGVMVHVPFCRTKCLFCMFDSVLPRRADETTCFVARVEREMALLLPRVARVPVDSLYFGGGTPSYLSAAELDRMLTALHRGARLAADFHFTFEMNPDSASEEKLRVLRAHGLQRLSLGVQSVTEAVLKRMNRGYQTRAHVADAVAAARRAGVPAVSLDTVCGLPEETFESFAASTRFCLALAPDSLIIYPWVSRPTPYFHLGYREDRAALRRRADEWTERLTGELAAAGYRRNDAVASPVFVRAGHRDAVLNTFDLQREEGADACLGFGPHAHSHVFGALYYRYADPERYGAALDQGRLPEVLARRLDLDGERRRYVIGTLARGLPRAGFRTLFGAVPEEAFPEEFAYLSARGAVRRVEDRWALADRRDAEVAPRVMLFYGPAEWAGMERVYLSERGRLGASSGQLAHGARTGETAVAAVALTAHCNNRCAECESRRAACGVPSVSVPETPPAAERAAADFAAVTDSFTTQTPRAQSSDFKASASSATAADAAGGRGEPQGAASGVGLQASDQARATLKPEVWSLKPGVTPHSGATRHAAEAAVEETLCAARAAGAARAVFTGCERAGGGEPTLHPGFLRLLTVAQRMGFRQVEVRTNGRLFAYPGFAARARRAGLTHARVMLAGFSAGTHDAATGTPGAFAETRRGLDHLIDAGLAAGLEVQYRLDATSEGELTAALRALATRGVRRFLCERLPSATPGERPELFHLARTLGLTIRLIDREKAEG